MTTKRMFQKNPYKKQKIPTALRNQVWITTMGEIFVAKCPTTWCTNKITPFTFEAGHDIPESKGGQMTLQNLIPICSSCNKSMGNTHTFKEWCAMYTHVKNPSILNSSKSVDIVKPSSSWRCC